MRVVSCSVVAAFAFALAMLAAPCVVSAWRVLDTYLPSFKDPYSGRTWDTLLDLDVQTSCVTNNLRVNVTIPTHTSGESNANFVGASFVGHVVPGTSKHSTVGGVANDGPTSVTLDWDEATHTFTFYNFIPGESTAAGANPGYLNINFDVIGADFFSQNGQPPIIPLIVQLNADRINLNPQPEQKITLIDDSHFVAYDDGSRCGGNNPGGSGDPVFAGFQGQQFQFHGLPDEHFNLISSPDVQLNSHFVYLSSGKCDYNDTECFTHPGTYMDVLGLSVADAHIKMVAGTHEAGLRVWVNDMEIPRGTHIKQLSSNVTATMKYHHNGIVEINTELIGLEVINSDMFMNVRAALNNQQLLRVGAQKHTVTDHLICKTNTETHNHQLIESTVAKKYPVNTQLHGLIGQTWRNVLVCGKNWMGTVQDYMVSDLFASDNHYNYFKW